MLHVGAHGPWTPLVSVGLSHWGVGSALPRTWVVVFSATCELFLGIATALSHGPPHVKPCSNASEGELLFPERRLAPYEYVTGYISFLNLICLS